MIPPSPVVICFVAKKEKAPAFPILPTFRPLYSVPCAWAQSSMMGILNQPSKVDEKKVDESLAKVGIADLRNLGYNSLSGGQRQRTLIARALAVDPDVLILDEPTNGMDTPSHYSLLKLISELHSESNLTVLLVSHLLSDVANLVKKLMLFEAGRFQSGLIEDMLSEKNLGQTYSANIEVKKINGEYHITSRHN